MSRLPELGTVKRVGAILAALVLVLAAGVVVGQAPALFGADVADDPEASINFSDQTGDGTSVDIENVSVSDGGFVLITSDSRIIGVSEYLAEGTHENVTVEQREDDMNGDREMLGQLTATVHQDATGNETFVGPDDIDDDADHDRPYIDDEGYPVSDTATVSMADGPEEGETSTSFIVESANATDRVPLNDTLDITSEIRNPNDFEDRQHVDFRIDGEVRERQIISLSADETRQLNFTIDLTGVEPGEHNYGILTNEDGIIEEFLVEYAPAEVTVSEATPETITANATLATDGFLAVENENGTVVATSDALEYGDHEDVMIDVEDEFDDNETATVVVYGGDPEEMAAAAPYLTDEGERVQSMTVVEADEELDDQLSPGDQVDADDEASDDEADADEADDDENGDDDDGEESDDAGAADDTGDGDDADDA